MASTDYNTLKARTLGSGAVEEAVTVNTRALIDKVLARYSGEWTVLRELLQNAADASASRVTIKFETTPSYTVPIPQDTRPSNLLKHTISNNTLKRLVISNNGQPFNGNDWSRLKRIAEGNPDETKIGAFGVGFYSVFAECEEPFVSSGNEAMAFYWKGNSLFTRHLKLSQADLSPLTNFVLDYRNTTSPVPPLLSLAQFLASSLTFVGIENIDLWIDEWNIVSFAKKTAPPQEISIPRDVETKTSEGLMKIMKVTGEVAQIDGKWMDVVGWSPRRAQSRADNSHVLDNAPSLRKFFSRLAGNPAQEVSIRGGPSDADVSEQDLTTTSSKTVFLHINTATIGTSTTATFNQELERATKKPPPKTTKLAVLTTPFLDDGSPPTYIVADVFATILPTKTGKIFIGFPTHQTTGLSAHISAPSVIPTVERESIDLNARWVRTWNIEMLRAAGIVCRIAWSAEMTLLEEKIQRTMANSGKQKIRIDNIVPVLSEGIAIANNFTFRESTPSAQTSQILENAFWTCSTRASIDVLSTCGILPTYEIRLAPKDLSFMEGIPVLPEQLVAEAKLFVDKLVDFGLVTGVTVSDIKKSLENSALSSKQVSEFLSWIGKQSAKGELDKPTIKTLLSVAVANGEAKDGSPSEVLVLGSMKYFMNPSKIPVDMPVPSTVMPFRFTKGLLKADLESLGWQELQIVPWIEWLVEEAGNRSVLTQQQDLTQTSAFASQALAIVSRQYDNLGQSSKSTIVDLLSGKPVIPTKFGMKRPRDAYFPSVKLFDDLPILIGLNGVKDKFLLALGVRKTVELGVVFDRLLSEKVLTGDEKSKFRHVDLIAYLASVRDDIPSADIQRLKNTPICPCESKKALEKSSTKRYAVSELFEPRPQLRELDLPLLSWPVPYRSGSLEGKFLSMLGLRNTPTVTELINIMAGTDNLSLKDKAMAYFVGNHHTNGYASFDYSQVVVPFLPLENDSSRMSTPSKCFVDPGAVLLGFDILRKDLQLHATKFGVRNHPPIDTCIDVLLSRPPTSMRDARNIFAYFAGRLSEINATNIPRLSDSKFIPTFSSTAASPTLKRKHSGVQYVSPRNCFLGESDTYGEIFHFVDFGQEGNAFLLKSGSKHEPTKLEVAQILVREPARISSTFRDPDKYLDLLRSMAESISTLKKNKELFKEMRKASFLLASKELLMSQATIENPTLTELDEDFEEESQGIREWQLTSAADALIIDDYVSYNLFKTSILAAPQEEVLEDFYYSLGAPLLSSLVEEAARHGQLAKDQSQALRLQKQIYERSRLFLHDQPSETIKHDARWLEKNLRVQAVSSIRLRRSLKDRNVSHEEKRTAVVTQVNREYTLWISGDRPDFYQVSQALIHLLLTRPKIHSAITLEMMLKTDLYELRARGFNVGRILRQKAAEARLAESIRQQQLEEERKKIEEQERAWKNSQHKQQPVIPGDFPDSPEMDGGGLLDDSGSRQPRGLLSNLTKQFSEGRAGRQLQSFLGNNIHPALANGTEHDPPPPPYSKDGKPTSSPITAPHQLHENLLSGIKKSRPHNSTDIFSRGETNTVNETTSYCDEHPAHDLRFVADLKHGIQMFLSSPTNSNASAFLAQNVNGLNFFAALLKDVSSIFALNLRSVNIFYETDGKTIAFNRNGSIFCNYLYFQQLHERGMSEQGSSGKVDGLVYWWVILCHELAHNLVADHSSNHSYYTEGFVTQYFGRVMGKVLEMQGAESDRLAEL